MKVNIASWLLKLKTQPPHKWSLFLLLVFLPTQLGLHFWPSFSLVLGRRIDYLSPTLYFTDSLVFIFVFFVTLQFRRSLFQFLNIHKYGVLCLIVVMVVNLLLSSNVAISFFWWLRVIELALFSLALIIRQTRLSEVVFPLSVGIFGTAILALHQFLSQHSVGGFLYYLGERSFSLDTPAIAHLVTKGRLLLRPYGTFPHPNVLAGFCVVTAPLFLAWKTKTNFEYMLKGTTVAALALLVLISFSRSAWLVLGILLTALLIKKVIKRSYLLMSMGLLLLVLEEMLIGRFLGLLSTDSISISERNQLSTFAIMLWQKTPLVGIGLGNFIPSIPQISRPPYLLQPAHSLYLLLLSETGIIGLFGFSIFVLSRIKSVYQYNLPILYSLMAIVLLGLFDHYFYTIHQTQLIFAFVIGLSFVKDTRQT